MPLPKSILPLPKALLPLPKSLPPLPNCRGRGCRVCGVVFFKISLFHLPKRVREFFFACSAPWFRTAKNRDICTGQLPLPFALLARSAALIHSLTLSWAHGKVYVWMSQNDLVMSHSVAASSVTSFFFPRELIRLFKSAAPAERSKPRLYLLLFCLILWVSRASKRVFSPFKCHEHVGTRQLSTSRAKYGRRMRSRSELSSFQTIVITCQLVHGARVRVSDDYRVTVRLGGRIEHDDEEDWFKDQWTDKQTQLLIVRARIENVRARAWLTFISSRAGSLAAP